MKMSRLSGIFIVESDGCINILASVSLGRESAKTVLAMAIWPLILVCDVSKVTPNLLRHELIHLAQQRECLVVGLYIWSVIEGLYIRWWKVLSGQEAYLYRSTEQEAYRHQHDPNYLINRPPFFFFRYISDKRIITFVPGEAPNVTVGDSR